MHTFISLVRKEFIHFFRDPIVAGLILYHFTVCIVLCGYSFLLESHHLKVAVYDMNRSSISRDFIGRFFTTEYFDIDRYVNNMDQVRARIDSGEAQAALIVPAGFSRDILDGKGGNVQYIADGSDANTAGQGIGYAAAIIEAIDQGLTLENLKRRGQQIDALPGISNQIRPLYNQGVREVYFVVISHILIAGVIGGLILSSTAIVREKEFGTIDQLLVTPISTFELLLAKSIAPLMICLVATAFSFLVVFMFGVPLKGSILVFFAFTVLFLSSMIGIGVLIGSICNNMLQTILLSFLIWFPFSFLSGAATPVENMLPAIQVISDILPATHYMIAANAIFQKGLGFSELWPQALNLLFSAILLFSMGAGITWRRWRQ
jgi:ABC-2 type transport system permease protein